MFNRTRIASMLILAIIGSAASLTQPKEARAASLVQWSSLTWTAHINVAENTPPAVLTLNRTPPRSGTVVYGSIAFNGGLEAVSAFRTNETLVVEMTGGTLVLSMDGTWKGFDNNNNEVMGGTWNLPG